LGGDWAGRCPKAVRMWEGVGCRNVAYREGSRPDQGRQNLHAVRCEECGARWVDETSLASIFHAGRGWGDDGCLLWLRQRGPAACWRRRYLVPERDSRSAELRLLAAKVMRGGCEAWTFRLASSRG